MSVVKKAGQTCLLYLRSFLFPLYKIPFILLNLLFGMYAFVFNDQGQDLMATFNQYAFYEKGYLSTFICFLIVWGIGIWNAARLLLTAANLTAFIQHQVPTNTLMQAGVSPLPLPKGNWIVVSLNRAYEKMVQRMIRWLPRVLSVLPYVLVAWGCIRQYHALKDVKWVNLILLLLLLILQLVLLAKREQIAQRFGMVMKQFQPLQNRFSLLEVRGIKNILITSGTYINSWLNLGLLVVMLIISSYWAFKAPSDNGCPGLIIVCGLSVYILLGLIFNLLMLWYKVPVFLLLLIVTILFTARCNDNHSIQIITNTNDSMLIHRQQRQMYSDTGYAAYWLRHKMIEHVIDSNSTLFIVASEGGGIRNCYWTYLVLNRLQQQRPLFYERTFAVTGVSGGSIGLGMYYAYQYQQEHPIAETLNMQLRNIDTLQQICSADYLSRVSFGLLFPDMLQRFIPIKIDRWDRSKMLANSFDDGYSYLTGSKQYLSQNYLLPWADSSTAYRYPVLLFNTILNEAGAKALFSPYRLSGRYYTEAVDLISEMHTSVPIKEAMTSSARFPIISGPGLVHRYNAQGEDTMELGHISDGGIYENTGIQTTEQSAILLRSQLKKMGLNQIRVQIIYIGTDTMLLEKTDQDHVYIDTSKVIRNGYEFAWAKGGYETIFGWIKSAHNFTYRQDPNLSVLQFGLSTKLPGDKKYRYNHKVPLGWYMSDTSRRILELQLYDSIGYHSTVHESLKQFYNLF